MTSAIAVAVLVAGGIYLVLQRQMLRVVLGFVLLGHAANLVLLAAGGTDRRQPPFLGPGDDPAGIADPLPQAFVLTAIVIAFAITIYLVTLAGADPDDDATDARAADLDDAHAPLDDAALLDPVTEGAGETADDDPRIRPPDDHRAAGP
ncbi:sodium:proton antiporter [Arthrobacter subterraneus]|uniref:sodium:proton antiporter n=1 Tax=Arthrobacter subterraneus TaxID=335973 RepID=UPI0037F30214